MNHARCMYRTSSNSPEPRAGGKAKPTIEGRAESRLEAPCEKRTPSTWGTLLAIGAIVTGATACNLIPVRIDTSSTFRHSDGTVEHKETHWQGTLDQLPAEISTAGGKLAQETGEMIKVLTEVPPPGKVTLGDLGLQQFAGDPQCDFLSSAKDNDGKRIDFQYVQLGAPSYDQFFKDAQVVYAILYQADQTVHRMAELSGKLLGQKIDVTAQLSASVSQALAVTASVEARPLVGQLKQMRELALSLGPLVSQLATRTTRLVSDGEQLVTGAAMSLTNPKVVAHLDLVKDGLFASVKVVKNSTELLVKIGGELAGFVS